MRNEGRNGKHNGKGIFGKGKEIQEMVHGSKKYIKDIEQLQCISMISKGKKKNV